ncbi:MAG: prenyltransferase [Spirochaetaceae bacterium]
MSIPHENAVRGVPGPGLWFLSLRPFSFTASIMPMMLALVLSFDAGIQWWIFICYFFAGLLLHAGTNVLNDYYDFTNGIDGEGDIDPSHLLPRKLVSPRFMKISGHAYFVAGIAIGSLIGLERGGAFVALGVGGAILAYLYTGARVSLKYIALGDVLVFFLLGPAMVAMGAWALRGTVLLSDIWISLPMAFLVAAILHANNVRDIQSDRVAGVRTLAGLIGLTFSRHLMAVVLLMPFVLVGTLIVWGMLPIFSLISFLAIVPAARVLRTVYTGSEPSAFSDLTMRAAMIHLVFSMVFIASLLVSEFTGIG